MKRGRRRVRAAALTVLVFGGVVIGGLLVATRTDAAGAIVLGAVGSRTNALIEADRVRIDHRGRVTMRGVRVRAPGVAGEAGRVFRADVLVADVDVRALLSGEVVLEGVLCEGGTLRVSQSVRDETFNLSGLSWTGGGGGSSMAMPAVIVEGCAIEIGEHAGLDYRMLRRLAVEGGIDPAVGVSGSPVPPGVGEGTAGGVAVPGAAFTVVGPTGEAFVIEGRMVGGALEVWAPGVELSSWPAEAVPGPLRGVVSELNPAGLLVLERLRFGEALTGEVRLEGVSLSVPGGLPGAERESLAADERGPVRAEGVSGVLRLTPTVHTAELRGVVEGTEVRVRGRAEHLSLQTAFSATLETGVIAVDRTDARLRALLPENGVETLDRFELLGLTVSARVGLSRAESGGPLVFDGLATVLGGEASWGEFPYLFGDVEGRIGFDNTGVTLVGLGGVRRETGASLRASGTFIGYGEDCEIDLTVVAGGVPIDETLLEAMPEDNADLTRQLFSVSRLRQLESDGVLTGSGTAAGLEAEAARLRGEMAAWSGGGGVSEVEMRRAGEALSSAEAGLARPRFALGGRVDVRVGVRRASVEPATGSRWSETLVVTIDRAGVLPEAFPYPLVATGVRVVIEDDIARLERGSFRGLSGGDIALEASFPTDDEAEREHPGRLSLTAGGVPIDPLLGGALAAAAGDDEARAQVRGVFERLGLDGTVGATAGLRFGDDPSVTARAELDGVRADPAAIEGAGGARLGLVRLRGDIEIDNRAAVLRVRGVALDAGAAGSSASGAVAAEGGGFVLESVVSFPEGMVDEIMGGGGGSADGGGGGGLSGAEFGISTAFEAEGISATTPFEHAIAALSPGVGVQLQGLRDGYRPTGRVDVSASLDGRLRAAEGLLPGLDLTVTVRDLEDVAFDLLGERVALSGATGAARLLTAGRPRVEFESLSASLSYGGAGAGVVTMDGTLPLSAGLAAQARLVLEGARVESAFVRAGLRAAAGERGSELVDGLNPSGGFDAALVISPLPRAAGAGVGEGGEGGEGNALGISPPAFVVGGEVRPRSLSFTLGDERVDLRGFEGLVRVSEGGVGSDELRGRGDGFAFTTRFEVQSGEEQTRVSVGGLEVAADRLSDDLRAVLPEAVLSAMDSMQVEVGGEMRLTSASGAWERTSAGRSFFSGSGRVAATGVSGEAGVRVENLDATVDFVAEFAEAAGGVDGGVGGGVRGGVGEGGEGVGVGGVEGRVSDWSMTVRGTRALVAGVEATGLQATVRGDASGLVLVPSFGADMHGGRLAGSGRVATEGGRASTGMTGRVGGAAPAPGMAAAVGQADGVRGGGGGGDGGTGGGGGGASRYLLEAKLSGVRLARVLDDLNDRVSSPGDDWDRGTLDADISLSGPLGEPSLRRGRGSAVISGGRVIDLPVVLPLLQFSNLQLPTGEPLSYADASFFIEGDTVAFERILVASGSLEVIAYGTAELPDLEIDLRAHSRASRGIPVLSRILEVVRDEFVTARVQGTLAEPRVSTDSFLGTRRFFATLLGVEETAQDRMFGEAFRRIRQTRERQPVRADPGDAIRRTDGGR